MDMKRNLSVVLIAIALLAASCSRVGSRSDAQVASDVQNKINGDSSIPDKQLNINANNGVVTLTGTVASDAARNAAANDAAQIDGVKTVVNNLEVAPASAANQTAQPQDQASNNPPPPQEKNGVLHPARAIAVRVRLRASQPAIAAAIPDCAPRCRRAAAAEAGAAAMIRNRALRRLQRRCRYRRRLRSPLELS